MKRHRVGVGRKHRVDRALANHVRALAREYARDVEARRKLGDAKAEYHAQVSKVKAYGALIHSGMTAREAIEYFREVSEIP